jgi:hypothetical protein
MSGQSVEHVALGAFRSEVPDERTFSGVFAQLLKVHSAWHAPPRTAECPSFLKKRPTMRLTGSDRGLAEMHGGFVNVRQCSFFKSQSYDRQKALRSEYDVWSEPDERQQTNRRYLQSWIYVE